jgi:hypothetical protein
MSVKVTITNNGPDLIEVGMIFPIRMITLKSGESHDVIIDEQDYGYNELKIDYGNS